MFGLAIFLLVVGYDLFSLLWMFRFGFILRLFGFILICWFSLLRMFGFILMVWLVRMFVCCGFGYIVFCCLCFWRSFELVMFGLLILVCRGWGFTCYEVSWTVDVVWW